MTFALKDRVKETSSSIGPGPYILDGGLPGFQPFDVIGDGNSTVYLAVEGADWEICSGTFDLVARTLTRNVRTSSNGSSLINWGAGTRTVTCDFDALSAMGNGDGLHASVGKPIPTGDDEIGIWDAASNLFRKVLLADFWGKFLKPTTDLLYVTKSSSRAGIKATDTSVVTSVYLAEAGREGTFVFRSGDYSARVTADTLEGIYIKADAIASSVGAWVRQGTWALYGIRTEWFGATGGSDDTAALQACLSLALTYGLGTLLSDIYTTTSALTIGAQAIRGFNRVACGIFGNHAGHTLDGTNVSGDGFILSNVLIQGNGTTDTNGTSTGLYFSSTTEITGHARLENVRFYRQGKGIDGASAYALFDSVFDQVDFLGCAIWGEGLGGSQVHHTGCSYRNCGWGVALYSPGAGSVPGGDFVGCTWVGNTFDFVLDTLTIRPLNISGCWFEQTKTISFGRTAGGEHFLEAFKITNTLFQPSATAVGNGVTDLPLLKGAFSLENVAVFTSPYALASLPGSSDYAGDTNLQFHRTGCVTTDGSTVVPLVDVMVPSVWQPVDADLSALANLISAADQLPYFTGSGTAALTTLSSYGRTLIDDPDAATARTTLGLVIGTNVQAYDADLTTWAGLSPSANAQSLVTAANYSAMRTLLGLGTAALIDTGTSGTKVALLDGVNTWSGAQTWTAACKFSLSDDSAFDGPFLDIDRVSASPAASDGIGALNLKGRNDTAQVISYARVGGQIMDPTTGSEDARIVFSTYVAGTFSDRMTVGDGVYYRLATGGDKGAGTINFTTVYKAGNPVPGLLTDTATYDPPSLVDAAGATTTVTVTGAALGDVALASFSLDTSGITITAWVSAANTVSVRFQNESGGTLDIGSGTLKAVVFK